MSNESTRTNIDLGSRIKSIRHNLCITQKQLAQDLNVSQTAIALWESGKREISIDMIEKIATVFHITPTQLLGWEQVDASFSGKEAPPEVYDKLKSNIEKHHGEADKTNTLAAHFDGDEFTAEELEEIKKFAEFVKSRRTK